MNQTFRAGGSPARSVRSDLALGAGGQIAANERGADQHRRNSQHRADLHDLNRRAEGVARSVRGQRVTEQSRAEQAAAHADQIEDEQHRRSSGCAQAGGAATAPE